MNNQEINKNIKKKPGIKILGAGSYIPPYTVKNDDFKEYIETDNEWIETRTGIKERHFALDMPGCYMGVRAALNALENTGVSPLELDLIIVSTCTPDYFYPSTACIIQKEIGATCPAFDISAACTGFIYALETARGFLNGNEYKKILIVCAEKLTSHANFNERSSVVLFGDGAGAVVIEKSEKDFFSFLGADGTSFYEPVIHCNVRYEYNSPFDNEKSRESVSDKVPSSAKDAINSYKEKFSPYLTMDGKAVYQFGTNAMTKAVKNVIEKAQISLSEIDYVIPHQANIRIIQTAIKNLKISKDKVLVNIEKYGNISSACIPVLLSENFHKFKEGMKIVLVGFGGGLTYGAVLIEM